MDTEKRPAHFLDLPLELQREIFQYLPYWELQKRRGVSRSWCIVTDSLNPDYPDAQSQNVRRFCQPFIDNIEFEFKYYRAENLIFLRVGNWNKKKICYPPGASFLVKNENNEYSVCNVTDFLKWNLTDF